MSTANGCFECIALGPGRLCDRHRAIGKRAIERIRDAHPDDARYQPPSVVPTEPLDGTDGTSKGPAAECGPGGAEGDSMTLDPSPERGTECPPPTRPPGTGDA